MKYYETQHSKGIKELEALGYHFEYRGTCGEQPKLEFTKEIKYLNEDSLSSIRYITFNEYALGKVNLYEFFADCRASTGVGFGIVRLTHEEIQAINHICEELEED